MHGYTIDQVGHQGSNQSLVRILALSETHNDPGKHIECLCLRQLFTMEISIVWILTLSQLAWVSIAQNVQIGLL